MSIFSVLFGGAAAAPINAIGGLLDKLFTSKEEKMTAEQLRLKLAAQPHLLQAEINKIEAAHRSIFVAGWRPFIGWVCGLGLFSAFLVGPLLSYFGIPIPDFPLDHMMALVYALLGLGGMRTYEKFRKVDRRH